MDFDVAFEEEQTIDPALAALIYGFLIVIGAVVYYAARETGETLVVWLALAPTFAIVSLLFATLKMKTTVNAQGVRIQTIYFINREIDFVEIARAEAVEYRPLLDYDGWGLRISRQGKAYNMRGNRGVQLTLKNGGRVLIGSEQDQALAMAIQAGMR